MILKKRVIKIVLIPLAIVFLLGLGIFGFFKLEELVTKEPENAGEAISRTEIDKANKERDSIIDGNKAEHRIDYKGDTYEYNENLEVVLFIGVDDREVIDYSQQDGPARNTAQADFLMLAVFDKENKTYSLLQINRDTITDIMEYDYFGTYQGMKKSQIALSHTYRSSLEESADDTAFAVSHLLGGIEIDNYFAFTMNAIPIINDSVGGVTVTIDDDFSEIDPTLIRFKRITLNGKQAENYVRGRIAVKNDPTNINRMIRQRTYMEALLPMLSEKASANSEFAARLLKKVSPYLISRCTTDEITEYIENFSEYTLDKIVSPDGEAVEGDRLIEFYVDDESLTEIVVELFYFKV